MSKIIANNNNLLQSIIDLIDSARQRVASAINSELTILYWNIGKHINENILQNKRADYGKQIIAELSNELTQRYGSGFSKRNLHNFIKFHELYPDIQIVHTLSAQFSWSHIRNLIAIEENLKREFYIQLCRHELWSVRTLQERISGMLYERTAISKKPEQTIAVELKHLNYLMLENNEQIKVAEYFTRLPDKKLLKQKLQEAIILAKNSINNKEYK
ncbi:MAG: hypothetical protein B6D61_08495 [Bacteroidetes bacterium 4484_249]|nr:MAG: hypothetical protein B6D61_08495 [Bacteroidetes bacterium 4484_249]